MDIATYRLHQPRGQQDKRPVSGDTQYLLTQSIEKRGKFSSCSMLPCCARGRRQFPRHRLPSSRILPLQLPWGHRDHDDPEDVGFIKNVHPFHSVDVYIYWSCAKYLESLNKLCPSQFLSGSKLQKFVEFVKFLGTLGSLQTFMYLFDLQVPLGPLGTTWTVRYLLDL